MVDIRKGPSGPLATVESSVEFEASVNTFYFDPSYAGGAENGSIAGPFVTWDQWTAALDPTNIAARVYFPGSPITPSAAEVPTNKNVVLVGISASDFSSKIDGTVTLSADGTAAQKFVFENLDIDNISLNGATYVLQFVNCIVGEIDEIAGSFTGNIRGFNTVFNPNQTTPDSAVELVGCNVVQWLANTFYLRECVVGSFSGPLAGNLTAEVTTVECVDTTFVAGSTVTFQGTPGILYLDAWSFRSFTNAGGSVVNGTVEVVGGSNFAPIQNTRYLDTNFVGTSNGSIGAPYSDLVPFFAEIAGSGEVWELWISPVSSSIAGTIPAISAALVVRGTNPIWTFGVDWTIVTQPNTPQFDFYDIDTSFVLEGGSADFTFTRCTMNGMTIDPTFTEGSAIFYDSSFRNCAFPTTLFMLQAFGGLMSGTCSWSTGKFYNVAFGNNFNFTPGAGESTFTGCTFGTGGTINNTNAPSLVMDAYSYASFIQQSVTYVGSVTVRGVIRGVTGLVNVNVPAQDTAFQDFAVPGLTASHRIIVNVNSDPTNSGIGIAGAWCTPAGNNVRVGFINAKAAPVQAEGFSLVYWATL